MQNVQLLTKRGLLCIYLLKSEVKLCTQFAEKQVDVFKDCNLNCYYKIKHTEKSKNLTNAKQEWISETLLAKFQMQKGLLISLNAE